MARTRPEPRLGGTAEAAMVFWAKLAKRLASTPLGVWALAGEGPPALWRARPGPRFWLGLALMAASFVIIPLCLVLGLGPALEHGQTWLLLLAGGALLVLVHLVFALGVYLAGADYARLVLRWWLGGFLRRYADEPAARISPGSGGSDTA